jgi:hypothetical protein
MPDGVSTSVNPNPIRNVSTSVIIGREAYPRPVF